MANRVNENLLYEYQEAKKICKNISLFLAIAGVKAATGAAKGAMGFELMRTTQNWTAPGYTIANTASAIAIGSAIFSPVSILFSYFSTLIIAERHQHSDIENILCHFPSLLDAGIAATFLSTICGVTEGMIGVSVLDLSGNFEHNEMGFAIAVGLSGGAMVPLIIFTALILARFAYLLSAVNNCATPNLDVRNMQMPQMLTQYCRKRTKSNSALYAEEVPTATAVESAEIVQTATEVKSETRNSPAIV